MTDFPLRHRLTRSENLTDSWSTGRLLQKGTGTSTYGSSPAMLDKNGSPLFESWFKNVRQTLDEDLSPRRRYCSTAFLRIPRMPGVCTVRLSFWALIAETRIYNDENRLNHLLAQKLFYFLREIAFLGLDGFSKQSSIKTTIWTRKKFDFWTLVVMYGSVARSSSKCRLKNGSQNSHLQFIKNLFIIYQKMEATS